MMLKKWTALLCAMMLVLLAAPALGEVASPYESVFALYDRTDAGDLFLGTAVRCDGQVLTVTGTASAGVAEPYLTGAAGMVDIDVFQGLGSGLALLTPQIIEVAQGLTTAPCVAGEPVTLLAAAPNGMICTTGSALSPVTWNGTDCYLTCSAAPVSLGAAVLDADGALVGLIAASWGESRNAYVVLPVSTALAEADLSRTDAQDNSLLNKKKRNNATTSDGWLTSLNVAGQGQWLTVDWSQCALDGQDQDSVVTVYFANPDNPYYSWISVEAGEGGVDLPAVPGRSYAVWARHTHGLPQDGAVTSPDDLPVDAAVIADMPSARPFNLYGYKDTEIYLGVLPAGMSEEAATLVQAEKIPASLDALQQADKDVYLQVTSKYRVKRDAQCDLLVVLTTPENYDYCLLGSFLFMTDLSEGDVWNCSLQPLLDDYVAHAGSLAPGEYTIRYYFDGALANTLTFRAE